MRLRGHSRIVWIDMIKRILRERKVRNVKAKRISAFSYTPLYEKRKLLTLYRIHVPVWINMYLINSEIVINIV